MNGSGQPGFREKKGTMSIKKSGLKRRIGEAFGLEPRISSSSFWQLVYVLLPILVIAYLAYGPFFVPALFMDDWTSVIERVITGNAHWLDLADSRPLLFAPFLIQYRLFNLNVTAYYAILWSMYVLMAFLLYKIVNRLPLENGRLFGLLIALLFLVYPTNYTHMFLIMLGIYCAIALTFLYGYWLLRFAEGERWLYLVLASTCLLVSFGFYEAQAGVAAAWAVILLIVYRQTTVKRYLSLLIPVLIVGTFSLWRTLGQQSAGIQGQYLSRMVLSPNTLLFRLLSGYKLSIGWGWTYPMEQLLPWVSGAKFAALLLFIVIIALWWTVSRMAPGSPAKRQLTEISTRGGSFSGRWSMMRIYLLSAAFGLVLIGAGYIPVIMVFLPSLSGIGSRFNIIATIGGAVFMASALMIGSLSFAKSQQQLKILFLTSAIPLILLGVVTQASVQYSNRTAWQEQQTIWRALFSAAPGFKNDTMVLFVLPDYQERSGYYNWRRTPLTASWEATSGLHLLYNNFTLSGDVYFPDIEEPTEPVLTPDGVAVQETGVLIPYAKVVGFLFDTDTGNLKQLDELPADWIDGAADPIKLCSVCITNGVNSDVPLRNLVLE
jgi:hypothetical protein